jgi:hypothetical protein
LAFPDAGIMTGINNAITPITTSNSINVKLPLFLMDHFNIPQQNHYLVFHINKKTTTSFIILTAFRYKKNTLLRLLTTIMRHSQLAPKGTKNISFFPCDPQTTGKTKCYHHSFGGHLFMNTPHVRKDRLSIDA